MKTPYYLLLFCLFFASCESYDLSHNGFDPITEQMLYDSITPAFDTHYFEIRDFACWDSTDYRVRYSEGNNPFTDSLFCGQGVDFSTADMCVFCNVLSVSGSVPTFWTTYDDIVYFLAPIDSYGEALFLAHLRGYTFKLDQEKYGIKKQGGKFYLKAFKLVQTCTPIQTDQFFLEIDEAGKIKVIDQKMYSKLVGACI
jgi:hypothetical protein